MDQSNDDISMGQLIHLASVDTEYLWRNSETGRDPAKRTVLDPELHQQRRVVERRPGRGERMPLAIPPASQVPRCQAEGCKADLTNAKHYHRRHKVCEFHSKATSVVTGGVQQRFCQQCSR